jgi:hypothetical protein
VPSRRSASCWRLNWFLNKASAFSSRFSRMVSCLAACQPKTTGIGALRLDEGQHTCVSSVSCYVCRTDSGACIAGIPRIRASCHRIPPSGGDIPDTLSRRQPVRSARLKWAVRAIASVSWPLIASLVARWLDHGKQATTNNIYRV